MYVAGLLHSPFLSTSDPSGPLTFSPDSTRPTTVSLVMTTFWHTIERQRGHTHTAQKFTLALTPALTHPHQPRTRNSADNET